MAVDFAVAEEVEQALHFEVANRPPQPDAIDVVHGNKNSCFIGHAQLVKAARRAQNRLRLDPLDDTEPMIRVDDLVANLECHVTPDEGRL